MRKIYGYIKIDAHKGKSIRYTKDGGAASTNSSRGGEVEGGGEPTCLSAYR